MDLLIQTLDEIVPPIIERKNGLKNLSEDEVQCVLEKVKHAIQMIDPKSLLQLSYSNDENSVNIGDDELKCAPIHNQINPPEEQSVRYLHVIEYGGMYSIGIFVFAPNAKIPLHNHPDMSVVSRVLYGSIRAKSYDIIDPSIGKKVNQVHEEPHGFADRLLKFPMRIFDKVHRNGAPSENCIYCIENEEKEISAPEISTLYPKKGNLHEFTAGDKGACVLDVLVPPYDSDHNRDCTYFQIFDCDDNTKEPNMPYCIVEPIEQPHWFRCTGGTYEGLITCYEDK